MTILGYTKTNLLSLIRSKTIMGLYITYEIVSIIGVILVGSISGPLENLEERREE